MENIVHNGIQYTYIGLVDVRCPMVGSFDWISEYHPIKFFDGVNVSTMKVNDLSFHVWIELTDSSLKRLKKWYASTEVYIKDKLEI